MNFDGTKKYLATSRGLMVFSIFLLLAASALFHWNSVLRQVLQDRVSEYRLDAVLAQNEKEYEHVYQEMLAQGGAPQQGRQNQNEWIRSTQDLVRTYHLELREISPLKGGGKSGGEKLLLTFDGEMADLVRFLHELAVSGNSSYVDQMDMAPGDQSNRINVEMTLAQF